MFLFHPRQLLKRPPCPCPKRRNSKPWSARSIPCNNRLSSFKLPDLAPKSKRNRLKSRKRKHRLAIYKLGRCLTWQRLVVRDLPTHLNLHRRLWMLRRSLRISTRRTQQRSINVQVQRGFNIKPYSVRSRL